MTPKPLSDNLQPPFCLDGPWPAAVLHSEAWHVHFAHIQGWCALQLPDVESHMDNITARPCSPLVL